MNVQFYALRGACTVLNILWVLFLLLLADTLIGVAVVGDIQWHGRIIDLVDSGYWQGDPVSIWQGYLHSQSSLVCLLANGCRFSRSLLLIPLIISFSSSACTWIRSVQKYFANEEESGEVQ